MITTTKWIMFYYVAALIISYGLHHAVSLGNIEVSAKTNNLHTSLGRSYDSEDENMGRKKMRPTQSTGQQQPKTSIYSKGDIREQYCLSDRQLSTIDRPRRDRFFGCWSSRTAPQSFLGVCVGRRAPSDENITDAPFYKYPKYPPPGHAAHDLLRDLYDDDDEEEDSNQSYFRRKPTSFLGHSSSSNAMNGGGEAKRYTWMPSDDESVRLEGPRPISQDYDDMNRGPYIVGSYPPGSYLSHSSEQLSGYYRCPAHIGLPPPPPPPVLTADGVPRTKHVSFARSHTLTSFDEIGGTRSLTRLGTARSQERLIGGKKSVIPPQSILQSSIQHHHQQQQQLMQQQAQLKQQQQLQYHQQQQAIAQPFLYATQSIQTAPIQPPQLQPQQQQQQQQQTPQLQQEVVIIEKLKRGSMKTQATQTEVYLSKKLLQTQNLSLSPRTIHRVKMVSQGAQTNGGLNGRKLTKSLSEAVGVKQQPPTEGLLHPNIQTSLEHEPLQRTQSEEPPKSPFVPTTMAKGTQFQYQDISTRTSSRQSEFDSSRSDILSTTTENQPTHSRNPSQGSVTSLRSTDISISKAVDTSSIHSQDIYPNAGHRLILETGSLPRHTCIHHKDSIEHYQSNSLPRTDQCRKIEHEVPRSRWESSSRDSSVESQQQLKNQSTNSNRRYSCTVENIFYQRPSYTPSEFDLVNRRSSMHPCIPIFYPNEMADELGIASDNEQCSSCESGESDEDEDDDDDDSHQEKEIFIDFKPRPSPTGSPTIKNNKLYRTSSANDIVQQDRKFDEGARMTVSSDEDNGPNNLSKPSTNQNDSLEHGCHLAVPPDEFRCTTNDGVKHKRETFRKRSISLDDQSADVQNLSSPYMDEHHLDKSYPSTDSPSNDITRDHSDGIWNESQATVLHAEISPNDSIYSTLLTPNTRRMKLQEQRSSIDTDALDLEEQLSSDQLSLSSAPGAVMKPIQSSSKVSSNQSLVSVNSSHSAVGITQTPSIAVIPSLSMEQEDVPTQLGTGQMTLRRPRKPNQSLVSKQPDIRRCSNAGQETESLIRQTSPRRSSENLPRAPELYLQNRSEPSGKNNTDISECSTVTDDYVTCTENSRRTPGIRSLQGASSSSTQVPVSGQSSQRTVTQDGSSFESASSLYCSARNDPCPDDITLDKRDDGMTINSSKLPKCSSSSDSYDIGHDIKGIKTQVGIAKPYTTTGRLRESVSDDEKSEKRYSSSGYYESPPPDSNVSKLILRSRRLRDWNEEERRRRKEKMRLDIEKENMKSLTSPIKKPTTTFKQISPDDRNALNVLDGASPNKGKRFRPKGRRFPRNRSSTGEESSIHKFRVSPNAKTPEKSIEIIKVSPTKIRRQPKEIISINTSLSPVKNVQTTKIVEKRLKAISTESLRSVSPGSDSVFYSEADGGIDHQLHCHHCGKEVELFAANAGSTESLLTGEPNGADVINIVKPPADFADSPEGPRTTRLYKKFDKRLRSEERHTERRLYRTRQENARAKSEERGKAEISKSGSTGILRPAGSSPCMMPEDQYSVRNQVADPEQGIYHGFYRLGIWICVTDRDVWHKHNDYLTFEEHKARERLEQRRDSTDSEKDFRKKYQALTHRLVHRKSCVEMHKRQNSNSFNFVLPLAPEPSTLHQKLEEIFKLMLCVWVRENQALKSMTNKPNGTDKTVIVHRESGEFGFRIHGSKPVVVSAIEPNTPAETSGLEVGDIVMSVNGITVIDKTHSEVVKIAHAGSDTLELEVARTIGIISAETVDSCIPALYTGYLWKRSSYTSGEKESQKWSRRWFSLRPDHCLYYYKSDLDSQPVGAVMLTSHNVTKCSAEVGRPYAFKIESIDGPSIVLAGDSEEASNRWVAIMSHASKQTDPWLEISTRHLRLPPNGVPRPDCYGFLLKLGNRWRAWSKRYCVLKDACLYFYHDSNSKSAFGMACLQGYRVQPSTANTPGKKYAFEVTPPESKLRHYCFSTESEMDKKRWMAALEYSIERWMRAG